MLTLLFFATTVASAMAVTVTPPPTVKNFSAPAYMGKWYQLADYRQFYEVFCNKCTTANYTLNADGSITVDNESKGLFPCSIKGRATCPNATYPGQCTVKFPVGTGEYWIVDLGPLNADHLYTWAIVSDASRSSLYLLHRQRVLPAADLAALKNTTASFGFDMSKLKDTDQTDAKCTAAAAAAEPEGFLAEVATATEAAQVVLEAGATTTLYKIEGSECGQATLDSKYAPYAEKFASLQPGTCAEHQFTVPDGTQTLNVPILGKITVSKFKRADIKEAPVAVARV